MNGSRFTRIALVAWALWGISVLSGAQPIFADTAGSMASPSVAAKPLTRKVKIAVFDSGEGSPHQAQVLSVLKPGLKDCADCEVRAFPIYEPNGDLKLSRLLEALRQGGEWGDVLHFSWNLPMSAGFKPAVKLLNELAASGKIIVASAGENPSDRHRMLKLSATVMGSVEGALLIGELAPSGALSPRSNYGPELFTALAPPPGLRGSSLTAPEFAAALATRWSRHPELGPMEVRSRLRETRKGLPAPYPSLEQLLAGLSK